MMLQQSKDKNKNHIQAEQSSKLLLLLLRFFFVIINNMMQNFIEPGSSDPVFPPTDHDSPMCSCDGE
jgi:hypothetical protein